MPGRQPWLRWTAALAVGVAAVPVWSRVLRRVARRPLFRTLLTLHAFTYLSWLFATTDEPQAVFVARAFVLGALGAGSVLVAMAMLADTIELDRLKTGQRREGMYVGAFELMQTTSFVIGPLVVGLAFSAAGLVPGPAGRSASVEWPFARGGRRARIRSGRGSARACRW